MAAPMPCALRPGKVCGSQLRQGSTDSLGTYLPTPLAMCQYTYFLPLYAPALVELHGRARTLLQGGNQLNRASQLRRNNGGANRHWNRSTGSNPPTARAPLGEPESTSSSLAGETSVPRTAESIRQFIQVRLKPLLASAATLPGQGVSSTWRVSQLVSMLFFIDCYGSTKEYIKKHQEPIRLIAQYQKYQTKTKKHTILPLKAPS